MLVHSPLARVKVTEDCVSVGSGKGNVLDAFEEVRKRILNRGMGKSLNMS